jgi:hypothetical protein
MKISKPLISILILLFLLCLTIGTVSAKETPKVRALLFYSPTCSHCHKVITEDLPPLFEKYGEQLFILGIDVSTQEGSEFFQAVLQQIENPPDRVGVPFLLISQTVLMGELQIPEELPLIIADGLNGDGIGWPDVPVVQEFLFNQGYIDAEGQDTALISQNSQGTEETPTPAPTETQQDTPQPTQTEDPPTPTIPVVEEATQDKSAITVIDPSTTLIEPSSAVDRFNTDKLANGIAVAVLIIMVGVVVWIGIQFMQASTPKQWPSWVLPVLLVLGFMIAVYLGFVEVTGDEAMCGPVGDCNAVQQSKYAKLFGVIPVAILGMIGYVSIGIAWLVSLRTSGRVQFYAKMAMFLLALFGLLFFIYLTFLEPFVIGATCMWCIGSAIIMTLLNLNATPIALNAWAETDVG